MNNTPREGERPEPYRPALVTLSDDIRERSEELREGLEDEDRALQWLQEITVRTLGRLDARVYEDLTRQFRDRDGVLLNALLRPRARSLELQEDRATRLRERLLARYVYPAHRSAFRELRKDATEYAREASEEDAHNPDNQSHIAMRPALDELETWQKRALSKLLDGFDREGQILDWGTDVLLSTHGEIGEDWVRRVLEESATVEVLLSDREEDERARRLFAAHHIVPKFRAGVRVLSRRAGELPSEDSETREVSLA